MSKRLRPYSAMRGSDDGYAAGTWKIAPKFPSKKDDKPFPKKKEDRSGGTLYHSGMLSSGLREAIRLGFIAPNTIIDIQVSSLLKALK